MLRQNRSCLDWHVLLLGLFFIVMQCDARAVNVSNTWTMPQEGLNVFYRFFRDRISWFEADAVCQFHHANLVTVDNSFQFDATRDLLRELDVNDIVWIGLMRPQSSDRFMWSNSRPLVADTGYWAESLPLMDAPLCAVIDPIRDYRWHALRCGGPETASFLCEMPVPGWADACNLKDMPNLTLQYMSDTASIELIRNCQEEGLLRTMCRGKQDRERALQDLICPRERLEAQRINDITNSHFKSLQIINSIPSDNNENNDIELLPLEVNYGSHYPEEVQTEKNTVQRLIEQFNVDELMQADEPTNMETVSSFYQIPGLIPKPVKKSAKKALDYNKKDNGKAKAISTSADPMQKTKKRLPLEMDEMMMGDQPAQGEPEMPEQLLNEEVSNEILEPLPHIKKTNIHKEDGLEKMEKEAIAMKKNMQKSLEMENKKLLMMSTTTMPLTTSKANNTTTTTTETPLSTGKSADMPRLSEDHTHKTNYETPVDLDNSWSHLTTTTTTPNIGHPMHPQLPRNNVLNEETQHTHTKESADSSHFIPPMLMVKSHYIPPAGKHGHNDYDHHQHHYQEQQRLNHKEKQIHLETTTEEQAETTLKHEENHTPESTMRAVTAPETLDLQKMKLKTLDTSLSTAEGEKQVALNKQEHPAELKTTATVEDSSMKPITTETELPKISRNLHFEEIQTTMTAITTKTLHTADTKKPKAIENDEDSLPANNADNEAGQEKYKDETRASKIPQASYTDAETTQATKLVATTEKSLKSLQKLYDLETSSTEKTQQIPDTTTMETIIPTQQQQQQYPIVLTMEEKLTAIKSEENKKHLQIITETAEKLAATQTAKVITTSATTVSQPLTQQTPTTTETETETHTKTQAQTEQEKERDVQNLQQMEKNQTNEDKMKEDKPKDQDKTETIVKTTETLQTSTASTKAQEPEQEETPASKTATLASAIKTSVTATTTIKPITTTLPQTDTKSTETSSFSTTPIISTTTTNTQTTTSEDKASSTTITPTTPPSPTSTAATSTTTTTIYTTTNEDATTIARAETSTPTSTAPETTRNFLKVTTELPFKPNRRRSLTKPETVSYMKKILG